MAEGETPSLIIMGSKYRKALEIEWDNKPLSAMRIKMLQEEADRNITGLVSGKFKRRRR